MTKLYEGALKIAVFESEGKYPYRMLLTEGEAAHSPQMTRVSEWHEVNFNFRAADELIPERVKAVDAKINQITETVLKEVAKLKEFKKDLLAIGFKAVENDDEIPY
jgi:hypothetical protein